MAEKEKIPPERKETDANRPPGELVQIDTVHYVNPLDRSKIYIYTVIDLYSRMAYAKASARARSKGCCNNNL